MSKNPWLQKSFFRHLHPPLIDPRGARLTYTLCLGGITAALFIILCITGGLLLVYYVPTPESAYRSLYDLAHVVPFGWWIRNAHYWAGQGMVVLVVLHMCRVVLTGAYQPPRTFNWWVGCLLLALTLLVDFTGYVLRWDQEMLWAATVALELVRGVPWFGETLYGALTGGEGLGDMALLRFYVLHSILIPGAMGLLMAYHFWRVRKDGGISHPL